MTRYVCTVYAAESADVLARARRVHPDCYLAPAAAPRVQCLAFDVGGLLGDPGELERRIRRELAR